MTDRELLEKAAKAAGLELRHRDCDDGEPSANGEPWNPLTDDGDALRLAVKLRIQVTPGTYNKEEFSAYKSAGGEAHEHPHYGQNEYASTRRAIVRAAAALIEAP